METQIHWINGLLVIVLNLGLAVVAWVRVRQDQPPTTVMRAVQGVAHLLLTLQVLLGVGLLLRGRVIPLIHPFLGILALVVLFLPMFMPDLRANRALSAAVVPTAVVVFALLAFAVGEMR